jgi:hypothetical protein
MADNNLETMRRAVDGIDDVIGEGDNLPEWCQEKIAVAKSMLVTVWDYMRSEEEIGEGYNNYDNNRTGFSKPKRDLSGEGEPEGMFMVMIDGRPWKEFTSNMAFARAKSVASKNPNKKVQVRWPTGQLNTVTEGVQRVDSLVTDALKIMKGSEVSDAVSALKTVLGDREYNGRRGHYNFYVKQILDMYSQQGVAEGRFNPDDYHDARTSGDYGMDLPANTSGSSYKEVDKGSKDGQRGRPSTKSLNGISKALPADAFGRTTGKIPASAKPRTKPDPFRDIDEESKGLWANIHAKRERIKNGSGEKMRKPGSKGAPTASALKRSAT